MGHPGADGKRVALKTKKEGPEWTSLEGDSGVIRWNVLGEKRCLAEVTRSLNGALL